MATSSRLLSRTWRSAAPLAKHCRPQQRRNMHFVPSLTHSERFTEEGVPGLFSTQAFNTCWREYQRGLVDKLNALTVGTELENKPTLDVALMSARQADLAATFNYASQAHNNHFFFETLSPTPTPMPESFAALIPSSFSSPEALKTELISTAMAMFGSGWVWLVIDSKGSLRVLCTYNAGTPYGAAYRRQDTDMNTRQTLGTTASQMTDIIRGAGHNAANNRAIPLLNLNCWEHAWVQDYGVLGKKEYLEALWNSIDWSVVNSRVPALGGGNLRFGQ